MMNRVWSEWVALALLALLVRAVVPLGYMTSAERGPGFVICSGQGQVVATQSQRDPAHSGKATSEACPFSALQLALDTPAPVLSVEPVMAFAQVGALPWRHLAPGLGLAAPPPPPTGPPTFL